MKNRWKSKVLVSNRIENHQNSSKFKSKFWLFWIPAAKAPTTGRSWSVGPRKRLGRLARERRGTSSMRYNRTSSTSLSIQHECGQIRFTEWLWSSRGVQGGPEQKHLEQIFEVDTEFQLAVLAVATQLLAPLASSCQRQEWWKLEARTGATHLLYAIRQALFGQNHSNLQQKSLGLCVFLYFWGSQRGFKLPDSIGSTLVREWAEVQNMAPAGACPQTHTLQKCPRTIDFIEKNMTPLPYSTLDFIRSIGEKMLKNLHLKSNSLQKHMSFQWAPLIFRPACELSAICPGLPD